MIITHKRDILKYGMTKVTLEFFLLPVFLFLSLGSSYRDECPEEPKIVIYLLVTGSTGTLKLLLSIWRQLSFRRCQKYDGYYEYDEEDDDDSMVVTRMLRFTNNFLSVFLLIWFVLGNVWVFRIWWPHLSSSLHRPMEWCNYTVYIFCVSHLIICHVMAGLVFILLCCLMYFYLCTPVDQD